MSLVGTLGRVALGVALAKGVSSVMKNKARGGQGAGGGLGGGLGGALGGGGGLGGVLGGLLGGQAGGLAGGLAGALGGQSGGQSGALGGLGALLGGSPSSGASGALSGGLGGLLEQIAGGGSIDKPSSTPSNGSLGDLLNRSLREEPVAQPDDSQEAMAKLFIQAMINAAKSDGNIDQEEQQKIVGQLGDEVTPEERDFVLSEMRAPLDVAGFARTVPAGAERQVYMMSLMGIELDQPAEAKYLDTLRRALNVSEQDANAIHGHVGAPVLYS